MTKRTFSAAAWPNNEGMGSGSCEGMKVSKYAEPPNPLVKRIEERQGVILTMN